MEVNEDPAIGGMTSCVQHRRFQVTLSKFMVEVNGIEPMTSCVQGRRSPN